MNKQQNFETTLPAGYREVLVIDAKSKRFTIWANVVAVVLMLLTGFIGFRLLPPFGLELLFPVRYFVFIGLMLLYIVLHELVHGAAYKLLTGHKLTFGITLTVAYCGVPDILVYRRAALIALLAPFTVFSLLFLGGAFLLPEVPDKAVAVALFAVHFSGCVGDLYDTLIYLFRLKDPATLMQDTGPKQTFYVKD